MKLFEAYSEQKQREENNTNNTTQLIKEIFYSQNLFDADRVASTWMDPDYVNVGLKRPKNR